MRRATAALVALVAASSLVLAGCGSLPGAEPEAAGATGAGRDVSISDAELLDDPKAYEGPTTAVLPDAAIEPVTADPRPALPATVVDAQGTTVEVTDTSRILALDIYGTLSRTVYELGMGDSVIGRDASSTFAEIADRPLVTENGHDLVAERILELAPTVVLTDTSLGPWDAILQVRAAGIPVVVVDSHRGIDNVGPLTTQVADALGLPAEGRELAERTQRAVDAKVAEIAEIAPDELQDELRMMFLYVRGQAGVYYLFGEESGADSLVDSLGGYDVTDELDWQGMRPVTDEAVVAAQPDLILVMTKGLESVGGVDGLLEQIPAIAQTPAGQKRRIVDMSDSEILSYGPRAADVLNALALAVYAPESS